MKTPDVQKELGRRIRAARLMAGLTQEEAAAASEIDLKRWQRLEQGAVNATVRTLVRVTGALGTTFWRLVGPASTTAVEVSPEAEAGPARKPKSAK